MARVPKHPRGWTLATVAAAALTGLLVYVFAATRGAQGNLEEERVPVLPTQLSRTPEGDVVVVLRPGAEKRLGLQTQTLSLMSRPNELKAYGVVLDPAPLISLNGQLEAARAALSASLAEYRRAKSLNATSENVSRRQLEAAEAQYRADQARVDMLEQQVAEAWGPDVAAMTPEARAALVRALVSRVTVFMRVDLPPGQAMTARPQRAVVTVLGFEDHPLTTTLLSYAPSVNPQLQGQGFLLSVDSGGLPLRPGQAVTAFLQSGDRPQQGVVIPPSAVVRYDGQAWAFVKVGANDFARRRLALTQYTRRGWFETSGFRGGERVVTTGAEALLSEELKSRIQAQD